VVGGRPPPSNDGVAVQGVANKGEIGGRIRDYTKELTNGGK